MITCKYWKLTFNIDIAILPYNELSEYNFHHQFEQELYTLTYHVIRI